MVTLISASQWLQTWERCAGLLPDASALQLLHTACPQATPEQIADLPLGRRDVLLLDIRQALFGRTMACVATCPACTERLELTLDLEALRRARAADAPVASVTVLRLDDGPYAVRFCAPRAGDMAHLAQQQHAFAAAGASGLARARQTLLASCLIEARCCGEPVSADALPPELVQRLTEAMLGADPQALFSVELRCPACARDQAVDFDTAAYLWRELDTWARRVLLEVHALASAYGWTEPQVLALSASRRRSYLQLCAQAGAAAWA